MVEQIVEAACTHCGSTRLIQDAKVTDQGKHSSGELEVVVGYGDPHALIFDDPVETKLRADICCQCGRVWLRVKEPEVLWEAYMKLPSQGPPA